MIHRDDSPGANSMTQWTDMTSRVNGDRFSASRVHVVSFLKAT